MSEEELNTQIYAVDPKEGSNYNGTEDVDYDNTWSGTGEGDGTWNGDDSGDGTWEEDGTGEGSLEEGGTGGGSLEGAEPGTDVLAP